MLQENKGPITKDQARDTGMAMVLICLLIALFAEKQVFYPLAVVVLVINMIQPLVYKPVAKVWFGLSGVLGTVVSKILLSIVFFLLVTPVGLFRRLLGKDTLKLKSFKNTEGSAFKVRDHRYSPADIETPY